MAYGSGSNGGGIGDALVARTSQNLSVFVGTGAAGPRVILSCRPVDNGYNAGGLHRSFSTRQVAMPKGEAEIACPTLVSAPLCESMEKPKTLPRYPYLFIGPDASVTYTYLPVGSIATPLTSPPTSNGEPGTGASAPVAASIA